MSSHSSPYFFVSHYRKNSLVFQIFSGMEESMDKMNCIMFFRPKFFVSRCRKKCRGTLLCFKTIVVMKLSMHKRGASRFRRTNFV